MDRKVQFIVGHYYHVYTRGIEKRPIFRDERDWKRFQASLYLCNTHTPVKFRGTSGSVFDRKIEETLTDIIAYSQMPNHYHIIAREKKEGGISQFMRKLGTSYSMYFNTKYERTGSLFCHPFRVKYIDTDDYFRWVFSYVNLNPLELSEKDWKKQGLKNIQASKEFISKFEFGSFRDYFVGEQSATKILNKEVLPSPILKIRGVDDLIDTLKEGYYLG